MKKITAYHFYNGAGGGVHSVIKNLLRYSKDTAIEHHIIHVVNQDLFPGYRMEANGFAVSQQLFTYSSLDNFYHTCKELSLLITGQDSVIIAHDWIELGMVSNLGLQNPVIQVLHGNYEYYYELAEKNQQAIDCFICISPLIKEQLLKRMPGNAGIIEHIKFPVPEIKANFSQEKKLRLIFYAGDILDKNKNFSTIARIASLLSDEPEKYEFTIAGSGVSKEAFMDIWPPAMKAAVKFKGYQENEEILELLQQQDVFLLPSAKEGLPFSLIESMKSAVVPLVSKWGGSADELLIDGITGFQFETGDAHGYVNVIRQLNTDRNLLQEIAGNAAKKANELFDPFLNAANFNAVIKRTAQGRRKKKIPKKVYGSRLDRPSFPNLFVKTIRKFTK